MIGTNLWSNCVYALDLCQVSKSILNFTNFQPWFVTYHCTEEYHQLLYANPDVKRIDNECGYK